MTKLPRLLTTEEAAEFLGYKNVESFRRAIRRLDIRMLTPIRDLTHPGRPQMFSLEQLKAQRKVMPQMGRPREGHLARRKHYNKPYK